MRAVTSRNATSSRDGVRHYIEMRVVGPHHDRAQAQSRCVTVSTSPAFMNTTCDRVSPLMRAPHPEREHRPRRRSAGIWFITKCRCTLSYVSSASIHTPHDRVNPLRRRLSALIILPIRPLPLPTSISARTSTPTSSSVVNSLAGMPLVILPAPACTEIVLKRHMVTLRWKKFTASAHTHVTTI